MLWLRNVNYCIWQGIPVSYCSRETLLEDNILLVSMFKLSLDKERILLEPVSGTCARVVYEYTRSYPYKIIEVCETLASIGRVSLARENEAGGRKSIFSMLTYRISFGFWL